MPAHLQIKRWQACRASESCRETRLEGILHRAGSELAVIAEAEAAGAAEVDIDAGLQRHRVACDRHAEHGEAVAVVERKPRRRRIREGMAPAEARASKLVPTTTIFCETRAPSVVNVASLLKPPEDRAAAPPSSAKPSVDRWT
jgi:hypothetical protein